MAKIVVYGGAMGSSFRPHWMLNELGLEYETRKLDFSKGEHRSPEFLALNPAGQIPVMVHDDFVLTESAAIVHFLAEKYDPKFFGDFEPVTHANSLRWQLFTLLNLNGNFTTLASKGWGMPATPEAEAKAVESLNRFLPVFEGWMKDKQYVVAEKFSVADIVIRSTFMYAEMAQFDLSAYPAILAWMARCSERPAFKKAKGE